MDFDKLKLWWNSTRLVKGKTITNRVYYRNVLAWASLLLLGMFGIGVILTAQEIRISSAICHSLIPDGYHYIGSDEKNQTCILANDTKVIVAHYLFDPVQQRYLLMKT